MQATRLKLQALAALTRHIELFTDKPEPGLTAEDRKRFEAQAAGYEDMRVRTNQERWKLQDELRQARAALAEAEAKLVAADQAASPAATEPQPLQSMATTQPRDVPSNPPVEPLEDLIRRNRQCPGSLTSAEALRLIKPGAFLGW